MTTHGDLPPIPLVALVVLMGILDLGVLVTVGTIGWVIPLPGFRFEGCRDASNLLLAGSSIDLFCVIVGTERKVGAHLVLKGI